MKNCHDCRFAEDADLNCRLCDDGGSMFAAIPPPTEGLDAELDRAATRAIESLGRYKFMMFGYWAGVWVHLNRISRDRRPNPFRFLVDAARGSGKVIIPLTTDERKDGDA